MDWTFPSLLTGPENLPSTCSNVSRLVNLVSALGNARKIMVHSPGFAPNTVVAAVEGYGGNWTTMAGWPDNKSRWSSRRRRLLYAVQMIVLARELVLPSQTPYNIRSPHISPLGRPLTYFLDHSMSPPDKKFYRCFFVCLVILFSQAIMIIGFIDLLKMLASLHWVDDQNRPFHSAANRELYFWAKNGKIRYNDNYPQN